ncbi:MAG: thioredoxin domain-containing protein [Candidatus Peregrinibacteria bacterium]|nr:thioredoxin domain-containing protein [Candidatus Peregrinibacteria bacterium]MCB9808227.1 thioredoxin domain-containing protein [Candidatus Peribacteria bacterium]
MKKLLLTSLIVLPLAACSTGSSDTTRPPRGNANASVLVEEFADIQCPACRSAHEQVSAPLLEKYGSDIRFEYKHFPLRSIHRFALDAAEMSECAADQGKFWEFLDMAYENQQDLSQDALLEWVSALGLNTEQAERCFSSHSKRGTVLADYKEGRDRDVGGTPTYFVNGEQVQTGFDTLGAAIEKALAGSAMPL